MTPTFSADFHGPDDEAFVRDLPQLDAAPDDADDWWLDLGRVEFPGLSAV